jgi:hypothetical protein
MKLEAVTDSWNLAGLFTRGCGVHQSGCIFIFVLRTAMQFTVFTVFRTSGSTFGLGRISAVINTASCASCPGFHVGVMQLCSGLRVLHSSSPLPVQSFSSPLPVAANWQLPPSPHLRNPTLRPGPALELRQMKNPQRTRDKTWSGSDSILDSRRFPPNDPLTPATPHIKGGLVL